MNYRKENIKKLVEQVLFETSTSGLANVAGLAILKSKDKNNQPRVPSAEEKDMADRRAAAQTMALQAGHSWSVEGNIPKGDMALALALDQNVSQRTNPRAAMAAEKAWNTDVGLAYDLSPDKELMGDPAGFKAVQDRNKQGRSVQFNNPSFAQMRADLFRRLGFD